MSQHLTLSFKSLSVCFCMFGVSSIAADWDQWRGPQRDGTTQAISLLTELPESGLTPVWINVEDFQTAGGWSSPILSKGRLYQYSHERIRREDVGLPPENYPELTEEQKQNLSPQEQTEYEEKHLAERLQRQSEQFRFIDHLICLDAQTGERIWTRKRDSAPTRWRQSSTPAVSNTRLYYLGSDRHLVCLDTLEGDEVWTAIIPTEEQAKGGALSPISSSPLITDDLVIVLAERLIALSAHDGRIVWTGNTTQDGAVYSSPAIWKSQHGTRIVANLGKAGTICVDVKDGRELWRVESYAGRSTPVVMGDTLLTYGESRKGGLRRYEMSGEGAQLIWTSNRFCRSRIESGCC